MHVAIIWTFALCCSPAHHNPRRSSRIFSRTSVSWSINQCPPIFSILETFRFEDFFQWCFLSFQVHGSSMLSSYRLGLLLGLFPSIFNFIRTLSIDSSSLLVTWPIHRNLFLLITWTMGSILLCLYSSLFLFLSHLVTPYIVLIHFMSAVVICCSSLFLSNSSIHFQR